MNRDPKPHVLIEDWLPVVELGIESRRERAAASALPPLSFLHVWWARRPLVASAAVVLGGLMPAWSEDVQAWAESYLSSVSLADQKSILHPRPALLPRHDYEVADGSWYRDWFLHLVGIWGDPITARAAFDVAVLSGVRVPNPYNYRQAYKNGPDRAQVAALQDLLTETWGELPSVLDSTAGGGSIPFESVRYGLPTHANDLNGVAAAVLEAGVRAPAEYGGDLLPLLEVWGSTLVGRVRGRLSALFPSGPNEQVLTYIWANAVNDPRSGRLVPLMTSKWLRKGKGQEVAVEIVTEAGGQALAEPRFRILFGEEVDSGAADRGTIARGKAVSPYDSLIIDGEYIKSEAQSGRMRQVLYAVAIKTSAGVRTFRPPTERDFDALAASEATLAGLLPSWLQKDLIPVEEVPAGNDVRPLQYGMASWVEMFTPRQRLVHGTFAEEFRRLMPEVRDALPREEADEVLALLALMQGKALDYNSRQSTWNVNPQTIAHGFHRHDFSFKWTFAEFEGAAALYPWVLSQLVDSYKGLSRLLDTTAPDPTTGARLARQVRVTQGNAADIASLGDGTVCHVCIDPPYYDNVMYAELADFFFVWEKRTLGKIRPGFFPSELCDKENEAVANPARFAAMGKRRNQLADADYESKMTAIFIEARRVLRDDGVLSVMFTHKKAEAWDSLGTGLLEAGFTIETSWPVNTEREQSSHQMNMNSASSTIMLVCRKRDMRTASSRVFFDDIEADIRSAARDASIRFHEAGIDGVDLLLSTYGPALSVISEHWPVYSSAPDESGRERLLRPEEALAIAREEVVRLRRSRLVGRTAQIDDLTDFTLIAWDVFGAREFPFDTARLLALAVGGLDVDDLVHARILEKKPGSVRLLEPKERVRRTGDDGPGVHVDSSRFGSLIDAVHTVLHVAEVDGMHAAKALMDRSGLTDNDPFLATVQGLVNAIPRAKHKGQWINPEAGLLDTLVTAYLPSISVPAEDAHEEAQSSLFDAE